MINKSLILWYKMNLRMKKFQMNTKIDFYLINIYETSLIVSSRIDIVWKKKEINEGAQETVENLRFVEEEWHYFINKVRSS